MVTNSISAVIPTRNRPHDLKKAVVSILAQKRLPEALIIIDQSDNKESVESINALFDQNASSLVELIYVHDSKISGLVEAKKVASEISEHEIICFLEDDVVLEDGYLEGIEEGFNINDEMLGCSGVITNQPIQSGIYRFMHSVFFRGILKDPRAQIFSTQYNQSEKAPLIQCDVLSGGLSAWRKVVLQTVPFDVANGFFMMEDIEFSTRVVKKYGHRLYINRNARLEHYWAPLNRDPHGARQRRKLKEALLFYKKRRDWPGAMEGIVFSMMWWFAEAAVQAVKRCTAGPVIGYCRGIVDGISTKLA